MANVPRGTSAYPPRATRQGRLAANRGLPACQCRVPHFSRLWHAGIAGNCRRFTRKTPVRATRPLWLGLARRLGQGHVFAPKADKRHEDRFGRLSAFSASRQTFRSSSDWTTIRSQIDLSTAISTAIQNKRSEFAVLLLPSPPVLRGRGVGGEGAAPRPTLGAWRFPPHPRPLSPGVPGERGERHTSDPLF